MSITQVVKNGQLVDTSASGTSDSSKTSSSTASNSLGQQDFLELLVAEMQYQDPLEPQSNTDYIAQLATFTQVQDIEEMQGTVQNMQANNLVGKYVILKTTSATTGVTSYVTGTVDYVMYENGETYLSVNDGLYSIDDLDTVADSDYMEAVTLAQSFADMIDKLPTVAKLTAEDADDVKAARTVYNAMTTYQKQFVDSDDVTSLEALEKQLKTLGVDYDADSTD